MTAARASVRACFTCASVSRGIAWSSAGSAFASLDLSTACAASNRFPGSGAINVSPPSAASTIRRSRLLRRTGTRSDGSPPATGWPVAASISRPGISRMKTRFSPALKRSRPSCNAPITCGASALPLVATALIPSMVSSKLSAVKRRSPSSYGPARAPVIRTASTPSAQTSATKRSLKARIRSSRHCKRRGPNCAATPDSSLAANTTLTLPGAADSVYSLPHLRKGGADRVTSATLRRAATLLGHRIVVAAFQRHPVGFQVLRARQVLGPGLAGDQCGRLPDDVELAVAADLANIDRLGDVVIGQHLGGTAGEVGSFDAGQRVNHLIRIGRVRFLDCLHPHREADDVRFHRIIGDALRIFDKGLPVGDELFVDRRLDRLEVVPRGEMPEQRLGVDAGELLLADREGDARNVSCLDALI